MKYFLTFGILSLIIGCTPLINSINESYPSFNNKYVDFLEEDETNVSSDYLSMISKRADGRYIERRFYPDTKTIIKYSEYTDKSLITQIGPHKEWSDLGVLTKECSYSDGVKTGLEQNYFRHNGLPSSTGNYQNDEKHGLWKVYKNGKLYKEVLYENGVKEGDYKIFNEEGALAVEGVYSQDSVIQTKTIIEGVIKKPKNALVKAEKFPLFGDGCPEIKEYAEKKKCSEEKMLRFIYSSLRYPSLARENDVQGMAIVQFVVNKEGVVEDVSIVRGICDQIRDEVLRVVNKMPNWVPGEQDGEKVRVLYTLPVRFKLE